MLARAWWWCFVVGCGGSAGRSVATVVTSSSTTTTFPTLGPCLEDAGFYTPTWIDPVCPEPVATGCYRETSDGDVVCARFASVDDRCLEMFGVYPCPTLDELLILRGFYEPEPQDQASLWLECDETANRQALRAYSYKVFPTGGAPTSQRSHILWWNDEDVAISWHQYDGSGEGHFTDCCGDQYASSSYWGEIVTVDDAQEACVYHFNNTD